MAWQIRSTLALCAALAWTLCSTFAPAYGATLRPPPGPGAGPAPWLIQDMRPSQADSLTFLLDQRFGQDRPSALWTNQRPPARFHAASGALTVHDIDRFGDPDGRSGPWLDLLDPFSGADMPAVVPLPPAILLFLTALGALFGAARLRKTR